MQRIADLLVEQGQAEYRDNPAHRRAKLLVPTDAGRATMSRITPGHAAAAHRLAARLGRGRFAAALETMRALSAALDEVLESGGSQRHD